MLTAVDSAFDDFIEYLIDEFPLVELEVLAIDLAIIINKKIRLPHFQFDVLGKCSILQSKFIETSIWDKHFILNILFLCSKIHISDLHTLTGFVLTIFFEVVVVEHFDPLEDALTGVHELEVGNGGLGFRHVEADV